MEIGFRGSSASMIGWRTTEKVELEPISTEERLRHLCAVYGFSYVIFTEQRKFTTAERWNGNGMVKTGHQSASAAGRLLWTIDLYVHRQADL